jgi:RNA polymerase sigma factor for flagellar operon FliA
MESQGRFGEREWTPEVARPGSAEREAFLLHYAPLVKALAARIAAHLPREMRTPDLVGEGVLGLLDALNRFDPKRGIPFGVYARRRIRGAILDLLRASDPLPRSARDRQDRMEAVARGSAGPVSDEEMALALGLPVERLRRAPSPPVVVPLDAIEGTCAPAGDGGDPGGAFSRPAGGDSPLGHLLEQERRLLVARALAALPEREKQVMALYYLDGLNLREIGQALGVTESRVCQIHRTAVAKIRQRVRALCAPAPRLSEAAAAGDAGSPS